jgi:hypothetical protein
MPSASTCWCLRFPVYGTAKIDFGILPHVIRHYTQRFGGIVPSGRIAISGYCEGRYVQVAVSQQTQLKNFNKKLR